MAEREGFEPPELSLNGFQDRRLKPLGHLSVPENLFLQAPSAQSCDHVLFPGFYPLRPAHILPEHFRNHHGSVGLLIVLQDRHDRTSHGKA